VQRKGVREEEIETGLHVPRDASLFVRSALPSADGIGPTFVGEGRKGREGKHRRGKKRKSKIQDKMNSGRERCFLLPFLHTKI